MSGTPERLVLFCESAAASSYHSRHCPAAASGSTKGLVDPSASGLSLHLSLVLGMASMTAPIAGRLLRSSTCADGDHGLGVWALMKP